MAFSHEAVKCAGHDAGVRRISVVVAAVMLAAACSSGSGSDDEAGADEDTPAPVAPEEVDPAPSAGCAGAQDVPAGSSEQTIGFGGDTWRYFQAVPERDDPGEAAPLLLSLHGYLSPAEIQAGIAEFEAIAATEGFVTVTPQAIGEPYPYWSLSPEGRDDVAFVEALLDQVEADLCVDRNRIFATGYSGGAMLSSLLACRLPDRVAAIGPVAGVSDFDGCEPSRPVPVLAFHGTEDPDIPFDGTEPTQVPPFSPESEQSFSSRLEGSVPDLLATWAARNGCGPGPVEETVSDEVTLFTYEECDADTALYAIEGGGHTWPGSEFSGLLGDLLGPTTTDISASELMWDFFRGPPPPAQRWFWRLKRTPERALQPPEGKGHTLLVPVPG